MTHSKLSPCNSLCLSGVDLSATEDGCNYRPLPAFILQPDQPLWGGLFTHTPALVAFTLPLFPFPQSLERGPALLCVCGAFSRFNRTQSLIHNPQTMAPAAVHGTRGLRAPNKGQTEKTGEIHAAWRRQLINLYGCHK